MELLIGDKVWSSWSMRPWLVLKHAGLDFTETLVSLRTDKTDALIRAAGSPSGLVPVLKDGDLVIWDSLAICDYVAEKAPRAALWPTDPIARALGRCAACEMHAGFQSLRSELSMDLAKRETRSLPTATQADVRRIVALWSSLLERFGGPFLLGQTWSIADAFFTPVATRFRTYGVRLSDYGDAGAAGAYGERLLAQPDYLAWERGALSEG